MAEAQTALIKNSNTLGGIRKSLMSFGKSLKSANASSSGIVKGLNVGNREKKKAILKSSELFRSRKEAVERRQREDLVESGKLPNIVSSATRTISRSSKGFLGRVMDFVGTIFIGWILTNLPTIIKSVQGLMERIRELKATLNSWVNNVGEFYIDFTSQLDTVLSRIKEIVDLDLPKQANKEQEKLKASASTVERDVQRMVQYFKDFSLGVWLDKQISGEDSSEGSNQSGSREGTYSSTQYAPILDLIGSAEGSYTSIAPGDNNPNLTSMTIAQANQAVGVKGGRGAIGRYQLTDPIRQARLANLDVGKDLFSPENQDKIALALIRNRGITADMIINNPAEAAKRLAMEFAGIPVLEPTQGYVQNVQRGQSYYRGYNNNAATVTAEQVEAAFRKFSQTPATTMRTATLSGSTPNIDPNTNYAKNQVITDILGGQAFAKVTSKKGWRWGKRHSGIDIGCDSGVYISLRVDAEVDGYKWDAGYGNVIDLWVPSLGVQLRFAHNSSIIIKSGYIPAGTSFATTGSTGRSTGPHIHFEVDSRKGRYGYISNMVPDPYVELIRLTNVQIGSTQQASAGTTTSQGQPLLASASTSTRTSEQLTPPPKSRTIPIPIPIASAPPAPPPVSSGGSSSPSIALNTSGDGVNSFINLFLLTELGNT